MSSFHLTGEQQVNAIPQNNANILIMHTFCAMKYCMYFYKKFINISKGTTTITPTLTTLP